MGTPFLMYHEIERPGQPLAENGAAYRRFTVTEDSFSAQLRTLADAGWDGASVSGYLARPSGGARTIVMTFDDGNESDLSVAAPLLADLGWGATFFVTTGFVGKPMRLTWSGLTELHALGFEIGSHGVSHAFLSGLREEALIEELTASKARLEDAIGAPVRHLSCPGGRWSQRVASAAKTAGFASVATSRPALNTQRTPLNGLARIAILRDYAPDRVAALVEGRGLAWMRFGQASRRAARRILGDRGYQRVQSRLLDGAERVTS